MAAQRRWTIVSGVVIWSLVRAEEPNVDVTCCRHRLTQEKCEDETSWEVTSFEITKVWRRRRKLSIFMSSSSYMSSPGTFDILELFTVMYVLYHCVYHWISSVRWMLVGHLSICLHTDGQKVLERIRLSLIHCLQILDASTCSRREGGGCCNIEVILKGLYRWRAVIPPHTRAAQW